jgi:large subunit ribosomal protein L23
MVVKKLGCKYDILLQLHTTEKTNQQIKNNKWVLDVLTTATRNDIKQAVEEVFLVKPVRINIINVPGKAKRYKGVKGFRSPTKKAIVCLAKGQKLDVTKLEGK